MEKLTICSELLQQLVETIDHIKQRLVGINDYYTVGMLYNTYSHELTIEVHHGPHYFITPPEKIYFLVDSDNCFRNDVADCFISKTKDTLAKETSQRCITPIYFWVDGKPYPEKKVEDEIISCIQGGAQCIRIGRIMKGNSAEYPIEVNGVAIRPWVPYYTGIEYTLVRDFCCKNLGFKPASVSDFNEIYVYCAAN